VWIKEKALFLRLKAGHMFPCFACVLRDKRALLADNKHLLFVAAEERPLPDVHCRSLHLPGRAQILADDEPIGAPQVMRSAEEVWNAILRINEGDFRPSGPLVSAAMDPIAIAVDERAGVHDARHRKLLGPPAEMNRELFPRHAAVLRQIHLP